MHKFNLIISDPPYQFSDKLNMSDVPRGAAANYSTLDIEAIKAMPVSEVAAKDALLALWVPSSLLQEGLDIMKAWGFKQKQTHIWVKVKNKPPRDGDLNNILQFGMGHLFRQTHELCLLGTRGKILKKLKNRSQRSVHFDVNKKHSAKPEILQERLELMFPDDDVKKLELFARRSRPGWTCLGNESPDSLGEDIRDSLKKLLEEDDNIILV